MKTPFDREKFKRDLERNGWEPSVAAAIAKRAEAAYYGVAFVDQPNEDNEAA